MSGKNRAGIDKMNFPFEVRRKFIHIVLGILFSILIYFDLFSLPFWGGILFLGIIFSFIFKKYQLPYISSFILAFERKEEIDHFPLRGALTFLFGSILSYIIFPKFIAISAIITLFLGDSIACLYGIYFGRIKAPWSPKKHLDSAMIGALCSAFLIALFFPLWKGFLAALTAIFFESIVDFGKLPNNLIRLIFDDNVFIPLISGGVLFLLNL